MTNAGPIAGIRIIDLSTTFMGPYCTLVLARMGADVVKVEAPDGDIVRFIGGGRNPGMGPIFLATNHGKRSVALDLKQPEGRAVLLRLLADADVFVTNMRPSALAKLELRYEDLTDDPMTELKKLCHFLDEDFSPAMISPREAASVAVPQHKVWHSNTHREVTRSRVGSWANRLDDWEIALCEHMLGDRLESMGYELTGAPKPAKEHVTAAQKTMQKRKASRMRKAMRDRFNRLREPSPVAAMLTTRQRSLAGVPQQRKELTEPV